LYFWHVPVAQNLRFLAVVPEDAEFPHPAGAALMRRLSAELTAAGWHSDEMENWRDSGWSVVCRRSSSELAVVLIWVRRGYWLLQVKANHAPGIIGKLVGAKASAGPSDVYELALAVHRALSALQYLGSPQWRWDGFPDDTHSTPEPHPA
jgi:hypothetical protein